MPAEAEHVRPRPQLQPLQIRLAAQLPGRPDELGHMGRQIVEAVEVVGVGQAPSRPAPKLSVTLVAYLAM